jgi:hypothetical protein
MNKNMDWKSKLNIYFKGMMAAGNGANAAGPAPMVYGGAAGGVPPAFQNGAANANIGSFIGSVDFCQMMDDNLAKLASIVNPLLASRTAAANAPPA